MVSVRLLVSGITFTPFSFWWAYWYFDMVCTVCQPSVRNHLLYTHMSNHYRRIYSAKSTVDTAPPHGALRRQQAHTSLCSPKKCELGLADIIASDKKNSPRTYTWVSVGLIWNLQVLFYRANCHPRRCGIVPSNLLQHHLWASRNVSFDTVLTQHHNLLKADVHISQKTHYDYITKTNYLNLCREIIIVHCKTHMKRVNILCYRRWCI